MRTVQTPDATAGSTPPWFTARAAALAVDLLVAQLLAVMLLALLTASGSSVRLAHTGVTLMTCGEAVPAPAGLPLPEGFAAADTRRCVRGIPWLARDEIVVARTAPDADGDRETIEIPVDATGHPLGAFYLDHVVPVLLFIYLALAEWRAASTLGKRLLGLRVRSTRAHTDPALSQALLRNAIIVAALLAVPGSTVATRADETVRVSLQLGLTPLGLPEVWQSVAALAGLAFLVHAFISTKRGTLPLHDWLAGTQIDRSEALP